MSRELASIKEQFEERIAFEVADKELPSISYILVSRDSVVASGHVQREDVKLGLSDKAIFRIASQSKMFTSICLMQLVERGLVDIDVEVSRYIPGFQPTNPFIGKNGGSLGDDVTLRKLMSHTAGMIREPQSGNYFDDSHPALEQTISELAVSVLKNDPSAGVFSYSNAGMAVVGSVIEHVSGQPFADYLNANVLVPTPIYAKLQEMSHEYALTQYMWEAVTTNVTRDWVKGYVHNKILYGAWNFYNISKVEN